MGFTGFTLVMPFLPLYIGELGVTDVGASRCGPASALGVTPRIDGAAARPRGAGSAIGTAARCMVERSLVSFVVVMAAMAFVTRPWHLFALRARAGAVRRLRIAVGGDGGRIGAARRMPQAIGLVQTAQRLGPAVGPVIGGVLAPLVGLRRAFLVTAVFYAVGARARDVHVRRSAAHGRPRGRRATPGA